MYWSFAGVAYVYCSDVLPGSNGPLERQGMWIVMILYIYNNVESVI